MSFCLNKLNIVPPELTKVTVISHALLASSLDTKKDLTTDTVSAGTVYSVVSLLWLNLLLSFCIYLPSILKTMFVVVRHLSRFVDMSYLAVVSKLNTSVYLSLCACVILFFWFWYINY